MSTPPGQDGPRGRGPLLLAAIWLDLVTLAALVVILRYLNAPISLPWTR